MPGYIVTRPLARSGLGSNLASLAGAVAAARMLGRELIVDWRGMVFLRDESVNYFTQYLETPPVLDGIRVHYAPSPEVGDHLDAAEADRLEIGPEDLSALVRSGGAPRYLVLTRYHGPDRFDAPDPAAGHFLMRRVFSSVTLRAESRAKLDAFLESDLRDAFIVGVNIATGNIQPQGRYYHGRFDTRIFENRERFLDRVRRATELTLRRLPRHLRDGHKIFYATESDWMAELLGSLPNAYTRRPYFPPSGTGRFFADYEEFGYSDVAASEDMFIDHFLLARCDALVYNGSMFSNYARVVTNYYDGNTRYIESLYARYWALTALARGRQVTAAVSSRLHL